eukprot:gene20384-biopygen10107
MSLAWRGTSMAGHGEGMARAARAWRGRAAKFHVWYAADGVNHSFQALADRWVCVSHGSAPNGRGQRFSACGGGVVRDAGPPGTETMLGKRRSVGVSRGTEIRILESRGP